MILDRMLYDRAKVYKTLKNIMTFIFFPISIRIIRRKFRKKLRKVSYRRNFGKFSLNNKCNFCLLCSEICPAKCIKIVSRKTFKIDLLKCIYCGMCVDKCPEGAITFCNKEIPIFRPEDDSDINLLDSGSGSDLNLE
jgi:formate hydrogenlyase subunit 6/NADH:ubiquinone oxidoreductase subunit I